jgi:hypothetical protein
VSQRQLEIYRSFATKLEAAEALLPSQRDARGDGDAPADDNLEDARVRH